MNEDLLSAGWHQVCDTLSAIKRNREWPEASFDEYVKKRWGLSKTRAKLFLKFSAFAGMCREHKYRTPDSPDSVQPILSLPQKKWLPTWELCVDTLDGDMTRAHIEAVMERFNIIRQTKLPQFVKDRMAAKRAGKSLAQIQDVSAVDKPGLDWTDETFEKAAKLWEASVNE